MSADKPDVDDSVRIVDPDDDPVLVPGNIKDNAPIPEDARAANVPFDVRWLCPIGLPYLPKPSHNRLARVGNGSASIKKNLDRAERYDPHDRTLAWSHVGTKPFLAELLAPSAFKIALNLLPSGHLHAYVRDR